MEESYTTQKLLVLRKLTRTIGDIISSQMKEYVATLAPLFGQRAVFGEHIQGSGKEPVKAADQAFKDLQSPIREDRNRGTVSFAEGAEVPPHANDFVA